METSISLCLMGQKGITSACSHRFMHSFGKGKGICFKSPDIHVTTHVLQTLPPRI